MTLKEIREEAWGRAREVGTADSSRYWTTSEMNGYINRVYRKIAKETKCIKDSLTAECCRIVVEPPADITSLTTLASTDSWYAQDLDWYNGSGWLSGKLVAPYSLPLSPLVLSVEEAKWIEKPWKLVKVSSSKWQTNAWWEQVVGYPTEFATDLDSNRIALNYRAQDSDVLKLVVKRMPLKNMTNDSDQPEFKTSYHDYFINGVLSLMYSKQDVETFNMAKVQDYEAKFLVDIDEIKQEESLINNKLSPNHSMSAFR